MDSMAVACAVTACVGGAFSAAVSQWPWLIDIGLFRYTGFFLIPFCWLYTSSAAMGIAGGFGGGPAAAVAIGVALAVGGAASTTWIVFIMHAMRRGVDRSAAWAMSDHKLVVRPTYSKAEAAEAQKEFAVAEAAYRRLILEHPADPEPRRRLAELAAKQGKADLAVEAMTEAVALTRDIGEKFQLAIRLSELQAELARNPRAAVTTLEILVKANPDHPGAEFARQRLALLRQKMPPSGAV